MLDFLMFEKHFVNKTGKMEIYPTFRLYPKPKDLMIRGGDFYAVWIEEKQIWSTDEDDVLALIDIETRKQVDEYNKNWYQNDNRSGTYSKKGSDISDSKVATGNKSSESRLRLENVERYEAYGKDVFGKGTSKFEGFKDPPTRDAVWDGQRYVDELLMLEDKRGK